MAELDVVIGASTKGLEEGATRAERALKDIADSIKRVQSAISENIVISNGYKKAMEDLTRSFKAGNISQSKYTRDLNRLKRDEKETKIETKNLTSQLTTLNREQKQLSITTEQAAKEQRELAESAESAANEQQQLATSAGKGGRALNNFGNTTKGNAVPAMQSFSQVIQDAPYGIQGVANNIQQLTAQFGYLSTQTGGTKAALKGMLASLTGPAGILLAVSALTTILVAYGDEIKELFTSTNKLAKATEEYYTEALQEKSALEQLLTVARDENLAKSVRLEAIDELNSKYGKYLGFLDLESVKTERVADAVARLAQNLIIKAQVQGFEKQIQNTADYYAKKLNPLEAALIQKKQEIGKELTKLGREIRGNSYLNAVIDTNKELMDQYNQLVSIATGPDSMQQDLALRLASKMSVLIDERRALSSDIEDLNKELQEKIAQPFLIKSALQTRLFGDDDEIGLDTSVTITANSKKDAADEVKEFTKEVSAISLIPIKVKIENLKKLQKEYQGMIDIFDKDTAEFKVLDTAIKKIDELILKVRRGEAVFNNFGVQAVSGLVPNPAQATLGAEGQLQESVQDNLGTEYLISKSEEYNAALDSMIAKGQEFQDFQVNMAAIVGAAVGQMITGIVDKMLEGKLTFESFGEMFAQMITKILAAAVSGLITQKITAALTIGTNKAVSQSNAITAATSTAAASGPAAFTVLPGLIGAATAMVQGAFGAISAFNFGGFVGDQNLVRMNGDERILTATQANRIDRLAMGQSMGMTGQRVQVEISGVFVTRGNDLIATIDRTNKRNSRIG